MILPIRLVLHDCAMALDAGTTAFFATDENGGEHTIKLVQHAFPQPGRSPGSWPGRLYFNGELVPMRSELETGVVALMLLANVSDDITQALVARVIGFVESDEYLSFAERVDQASDNSRYDVRVVWDADNFRHAVVRLKQILGVGLRAAIAILEQDQPVAQGVTALEVSALAARYHVAGLAVRVNPEFRWRLS